MHIDQVAGILLCFHETSFVNLVHIFCACIFIIIHIFNIIYFLEDLKCISSCLKNTHTYTQIYTQWKSNSREINNIKSKSSNKNAAFLL